MIQNPPFCVKIELTEGCNLFCTFCGLQSIRELKVKNFKFMSIETAERVATEISRLQWKSRIEFAMHGEPTMNPQHAEIVGVFRKHLPRTSLMMTSNGGGLLGDSATKLSNLFGAGLNALALDDYDGAKIVEKILQKLADHQVPDRNMLTLKSGPIEMFYYPKQLEGNPNKRRKYDEHVLTIIQDLVQATKGTHSKVHNTAGLSAPKDRKYNHRRCAKPFREFTVRHDGGVALCCLDWRGNFKIGNVNETKMDVLWQSNRFMAARKFLYHGQRDKISLCDGCTDRSFREGLLPDPAGQKSMPKPTKKDAELVAEALAGGLMTAAVKTEWENENVDGA